MLDNTTIFNVDSLRQELILMNVNEIVRLIDKAGYNGVNQLVGYILTNDLTYITSKFGARNKISMYSREEVLLAIINGYLER